MELVFELIKLGTVGVISGLFSSFLTNRNHRKRKYWELRVKAYQDIIESLSDLNYYFEAKLRGYLDNAYQKIRLASDTGAFLYSGKVNQSLREFFALQNNKYNTFFEYLDEYSYASRKCMNEIVEQSKSDLKV